MPVANVKVSMEVLGAFLPEPILEALAFDEFNYPGLVEVATSATETVDFSGPTTVSFLFLRSNTACTININGVGAWTMNAGGFILLFDVSITSLVVVNSSGSVVQQLEIFLGGT